MDGVHNMLDNFLSDSFLVLGIRLSDHTPSVSDDLYRTLIY